LHDNLRTCVAPDGRFVFGVHRPRYMVKNLRQTTAADSLGTFEDGQQKQNDANFPDGNVMELDGDWIYEIPNAFPFRGTTYILKRWADAKAQDRDAFALPERPSLSFTDLIRRHLLSADAGDNQVAKIFRQLPGAIKLALAVNSTGDVVGMSAEGNGPFWPILKPAGEEMQPLPGTQKATWGYAVGINDNGKMVGITGYLFKGKSVETAVLWPDAGSAIDLNKEVSLGRGEELESANGINNSGDILASGIFPVIAELDYVACLLIAE